MVLYISIFHQFNFSDIAGTVSGAVVDNLTSVKGNISSVYSAIKQRTSNLHDTLERSLVGSSDTHNESVDSSEVQKPENGLLSKPYPNITNI